MNDQEDEMRAIDCPRGHHFEEWNHGVRRLTGGPALPPNPARRRDAFKIATAWLLVVGTLLAAGATTVGLILGGLLVAACATVTATNLCLPPRPSPGGHATPSASKPSPHKEQNP